MSAGLAIGIDIGTSGVRAALVDAAGRALAAGTAPLTAVTVRDPAQWWAATEAALAALRGAADLAGVRAIAVDGTSGSVLAIDALGAPLGAPSLYSDRAPDAAVAAVAAAAPADSAARGATSPLARLLALQSLPGIVRVLHQADWLAGCLCGRFDTSDENNALKTGYDPVARRWPDWLAQAGADPALLPAVLEPGTPIAVIAPAVADRLGLPRAVRVLAGTTDGCAAFLATGASRVGEGVTSLGSTMTIKQLCDRPLSAPQFGLYSHRLGDRWLAGGASNTGGAALARFFDRQALDTLSARIDPARDSGLDYYPLPGMGERFPVADPTLQSRVTPRPADDAAFLHGLLEGIARIEALAYRRLAELGGPALGSVRSVGGGARNPVWTAIRARTLGVKMPKAASEEAALGSAGLGMAGLARA